jgi:hypothetical protein
LAEVAPPHKSGNYEMPSQVYSLLLVLEVVIVIEIRQ